LKKAARMGVVLTARRSPAQLRAPDSRSDRSSWGAHRSTLPLVLAIATVLLHVTLMSLPAEHWMAIALAEAARAGAAGEVPIGAVVVRENVAIAAAGNAPIANHDPTAHAEVLALRAAATALGNYRLPDCDLYVTVEPCAMCVGAALQARIRTLVFGCDDPKAGAVGSLYDLAQDTRLNHRIAVVRGVEADRSRQLLRDFFAARRAEDHRH
jgi:tRNA(adenine34) deaminase